MTDRRQFLKWSALGTAALATGCGTAPPPEVENVVQPTKTLPLKGPVVLSTWDHGLAANAKAWDVLKAGGSVLDAVESGVAVVESDMSNRSVGLGGMPDRDGVVTLDACIQDHEGRAGAVAFLATVSNTPSASPVPSWRSTPHVMLVVQRCRTMGAGERLHKARRAKTPRCARQWQEWLKEPRDYKPVVNIENHDTIGMIAMDAQWAHCGQLHHQRHGLQGPWPRG
jgi:N4-(beta-N-acetylglucosaminyl)-L-asparaginase